MRSGKNNDKSWELYCGGKKRKKFERKDKSIEVGGNDEDCRSFKSN